MSHKLVFLKCFSKNKLWKEWCDKAWIQTKAEFLAGGTNTASGSSSYQNKTTTDPVRTPDCSASKHHKNIFLQIFRECKIILFLAWIFYRQNRRISLTCRIRSGLIILPHSEFWSYFIWTGILCSVAEPEPPGAATFRVEPEPIFYLAGTERRSRLF